LASLLKKVCVEKLYAKHAEAIIIAKVIPIVKDIIKAKKI
jgi:hypothetical protein